jgi:hypothetical protein
VPAVLGYAPMTWPRRDPLHETTGDNGLHDLEEASGKALASCRPAVIDARITRWVIRHYSPSPEGVIPRIVEIVEERSAINDYRY